MRHKDVSALWRFALPGGVNPHDKIKPVP